MEKSNLTPLQSIVYDVVDEIQGIKRDNKQDPNYATIDEVMNSLKQEVLQQLREMYKGGLITFQRTVNGVAMFGIKQ